MAEGGDFSGALRAVAPTGPAALAAQNGSALCTQQLCVPCRNGDVDGRKG